MEHIEQLKTIRSEAIARLRRSQDFKLAKKLGLLLLDLGERLEEPLDFDGNRSKPSAVVPMASSDILGRTSKPANVDVPSVKSPIAASAGAPEVSVDVADLANEDVIDELVAEMQNESAALFQTAIGPNLKDSPKGKSASSDKTSDDGVAKGLSASA